MEDTDNEVVAEGAEPAEVEAVDEPRPSWLPQNFESEEAFLKSYKELERTLTERAERMSRLERQYAELAEMVEMQQDYTADEPYGEQPADQSVHELAAFQQAPQSQDIRAAVAAKMQEQQAAQALTQADQMLAASLPDWQAYAPAVAARVAAQPFLLPAQARTNPEMAAASLAQVYQAVKTEEAAARVSAQQITQNKMQAQTMTGMGVRQPPASSDDEWRRAIDNADLGQFHL